MPLELVEPTRQGIAVTRSFGHPVTTWLEMREALASYATRAAEKMRRYKVAADNLFVFMHTNTFNNDAFYSIGASARFAATTNDTGEVVALAVRLPGCTTVKRGKRSIAVHHRKPGNSDPKLMITLCLSCHAKVMRTQYLRREWPALLRVLWREQQLKAHEQTALYFCTVGSIPEPVSATVIITGPRLPVR